MLRPQKGKFCPTILFYFRALDKLSRMLTDLSCKCCSCNLLVLSYVVFLSQKVGRNLQFALIHNAWGLFY